MSDPQYIAVYPYMAIKLDSSDRALILRKIQDLITYQTNENRSPVDWFYIDEDNVAWWRTSYDYLRSMYFSWISLTQFKRHIYYLRDAGLLRISMGWSQYQFKKEVWLSINEHVLTQFTIEAIQSYQKDTILVSKRYHRGVFLTPSKSQKETIEVPKRDVESYDPDHESTLPITIITSSSTANGNGSINAHESVDETTPPDLHETGIADKMAHYEKCCELLASWDVKQPVLDQIAIKTTPEIIMQAMDYINSSDKISNRTGYLIKLLNNNIYHGAAIPQRLNNQTESMRGADYYVSGKYSEDVEY